MDNKATFSCRVPLYGDEPTVSDDSQEKSKLGSNVKDSSSPSAPAVISFPVTREEFEGSVVCIPDICISKTILNYGCIEIYYLHLVK